MSVKISIIVPVYNAEEYLGKCLDSISQQLYENFEVIVVNDGSSDSSLLISKQYAEKDSRFKVYSIVNHGVSYARNYGMDRALGDFFCFIDSDDYIEPNYCHDFIYNMNLDLNYDLYIQGSKKKLEEECGVFINKVTDFSYCISDVSKLDILELEKKYAINTVWGKMFKASLIRNNNIRFSELISYGEDHIFMLEYFLHVKNVQVLKSAGYCYFVRRNESLSQKKTEIYLQLRFIEKLLNIRYSLYSDEMFNSKFIKNHFFKLYRSAFCSLFDIKDFNERSILYKNILKSYKSSNLFGKTRFLNTLLLKDHLSWAFILYCKIVIILKKIKTLNQ